MCAGPSVTPGVMPSPLIYNWPQCHYLTISDHIKGVVCFNTNMSVCHIPFHSSSTEASFALVVNRRVSTLQSTLHGIEVKGEVYRI